MDTLPHNHTKVGYRDILRAINDRPYIRPEQILAILRTDGYEIGIGCAVIIFCQAIPFSLWQFHMYHPFYIL